MVELAPGQEREEVALRELAEAGLPPRLRETAAIGDPLPEVRTEDVELAKSLGELAEALLTMGEAAEASERLERALAVLSGKSAVPADLVRWLESLLERAQEAAPPRPSGSAS